MKIKLGAPLRMKDISAEVYEGYPPGEMFIRVFETKHESEVCLDVNEALALRDFINTALTASETGTKP